MSTGLNFRHFGQTKLARVRPCRIGIRFLEASSCPHVQHFFRYWTAWQSWLIRTAPLTAVARPVFGWLSCERRGGRMGGSSCWSASPRNRPEFSGASSVLGVPSAQTGLLSEVSGGAATRGQPAGGRLCSRVNQGHPALRLGRWQRWRRRGGLGSAQVLGKGVGWSEREEVFDLCSRDSILDALFPT